MSTLDRIQKAIRRLTDHQKKIQRRFRLIATLRSTTFFLAVGIIFLWSPGDVYLLPSLPAWLAFLTLIVVHARLRKRRMACHRLLSLYEFWKERQMDWKGDVSAHHSEEKPIYRDMLLLGDYSLLAFLDHCMVPEGSHRLKKWMDLAIEGPAADAIRNRQRKVQSLAGLRIFTARWFSSATDLVDPLTHAVSSMTNADPSSEARHSERPNTAEGTEKTIETVPGWVAGLSGLLAIVSVLSFFSHEILGAPAYFLLSYPALWLAFGLYLLVYRRKERRAAFDRLLASIDQFLPLLRSVRNFHFRPSALESEGRLLLALKSVFSAAVRQDFFYSLFRNPLAFAMGGLLFGGPILADWSMGRFLSRNRAKIEKALDELASLDALMSLAMMLRLSGPVCIPLCDSGDGLALEARNLHHPLLPPGRSVGNDLLFEEGHRLWIITGSNMGGKSTFLRTVGMNLILAQMGGPVRAEHFRFKPVALYSSMQIQDDLARSESLFYAEVQNLKALLEHPVPVLYFLDEMLKGTNQKDRNFASRKILAALIERGARGFLTTHDMDLPSLKESFTEQVQLYHFRESSSSLRLEFDFRLHPGSVEGTTALTILRNEGLPV